MDDQRKWEGLFRGSVLSMCVSKHTSFITSADTRAQGLILLNTALVPLALSAMQTAELRTAGLLCALTALITITLCIFCLYPKRLPSKTGLPNLFHYVEFSRLEESDFLERMGTIFADKEQLAQAALRDLYLLGSRIVQPKYAFLRLAYATFLLGQLTAALLAVAASA